jgi:hypothetical protein
MNWYYVAEGKSIGPIEDEAFQNLVTAGLITMDTMVWNEGMTDWKPYREVAPASQRFKLREPGQMLAAMSTEGVCVSCGNTFPKEEMLPIENNFVCARCKPIYVQRLKEGLGAAGGPVDAEAMTKAIIDNDYNISIGDCIGRGIDLMKSNFWPMVGTTILVVLAILAAQNVPYIGPLISLIVQGPLVGGIFWYYIRSIRGQEAGLAEAFGGFGPKFVQTMLAHAISSIMAGLIMAPGIVCMVMPLFWLDGAQIESPSMFFAAVGPLFLAGIGLFIVGWLIVMYLMVSWVFAIPLVMDKGLDFWPALEMSRKVVSRHWWKMFALFFIVSILGVFSFCLCCLPMPAVFAALAYAYEDIFGKYS